MLRPKNQLLDVISLQPTHQMTPDIYQLSKTEEAVKHLIEQYYFHQSCNEMFQDSVRPTLERFIKAIFLSWVF
jgi:hypothetical protein